MALRQRTPDRRALPLRLARGAFFAFIHRMDPFFHLDATAQADLVRRGEAHPLELLDAAFARIDALNPHINAVTALFEKSARRQAMQPVQGGPFAGVPYLIKDLAAVGGAALTYGSRLFANNVARRNEAIVRRALQAGFILAGKTNTAEFGLLPTTEPLLHGATRNPWDLERSPGGSSGGAAAAVAAGLVPVAQGGDGGGSIRIPASCCGVFGLKPSRGTVVPPLRRSPGDLSVNLCLSRSVRDTARQLCACEADGGIEGLDARCVTGPSPRRLRIAFSTRTFLGTQAEPEVKAAIEDVARLCESLGHHVEEAAPVLAGEEAVTHFLAFWAAGPAMLVKNFWLIRLKTWCATAKANVLEPWTLGLADWFLAEERKGPGLMLRAERFFEVVGRELDGFFDRYDVHLTPVLRRLPPRLGELAPTVPFETLLARCVDHIAYTPLHNAVGTPAMSVPLSISPSGLPIGSQFAARRGDERTLLHLAYELEAAKPWAGRWPPLVAERIATGNAVAVT